MQITCHHCQAGWEYADRRPAFCPFCGQPFPGDPLAASPSPAGEVTTPFIAENVTQPPSTPHDNGAADPGEVGGYRLLRVLGAGGMGKVYEAADVQTGRRVALKLISADYAGSPEAVERFRQEGRLASLIAHPRCVFVLAADEEAGRPYIVMELMPGNSLDDYVRLHGPRPPGEAVAMILDVIEGLQEAHRVGVVHRDVKPSNCFFGADGRLKVGDFGLSKSLAQGAHLTKTGSFLGTPLYASPEQVRGELVDAQTDVYSAAATLYFLLTGRAPFQSDNAAVTLARIASDPPPSLRTLRPELSPALDAVVLRGLERDRKRRWRDLDEFAEALRPFLPGRLSLAGLGVRFGALALDYFILGWVIGLPLGILLLASGLIDPLKVPGQTQGADVYGAAWQLLGFLQWFLYLGLPEGLWGCSLGKWLLGLRVRNVFTGQAPGIGRGLLRFFLFFALLNGGAWVTIWILRPLLRVPVQPTAEELFSNPVGHLLVTFTPLAGFIAGLVLMVCTMRARNGYRGLHEFLSGTCVVPLPGRTRRAITVAPSSRTLSRFPGVPEKVGAFDVRGAFRWDERAKALLGIDAALGRQVVLWLRPADEAPLDAKRREVNRITRLRWLAAGHGGELQWDAFVAPGGGPLTTLIEVNGRLSWAQVQPLLEQLTDEFLLALKEGTLPGRLEPAMVWVRADGRAILLDVPVTEPAESDSGPGAGDGPEQQALALLARVAARSLEGQAHSEQLPRTVRAPLPLPAAAALRELLAFRRTGFPLRAFRERLSQLQEKPREVTRARRAGQLALMALFLFFAFGCCLSPAASFSRFGMALAVADMRIDADRDALENLNTASLGDVLCASSNPNVLGRTSLIPALEKDQELRRQLEDDIERTQRRLDERVQWGGSYYQHAATSYREQQAKQRVRLKQLLRGQRTTDPGELRRSAELQAKSLNQMEDVEEVFGTVQLIPFFLGPALWVGWAFLTRGGLSYWLLGIAPVRRDGRLAGRFQCAWRALLVWVPVAGLLLLSYWLEAWYWSLWGTAAAPVWALWLSTVIWWATWLLLGAYIILALRYPTRSLHDRLAGTYLVPR